MRLIRLNTRMFRFLCLVFGLFLAYEGYRQFPVITEPTLDIAADTMEGGFSQLFGTAMLIVGSLIAGLATTIEGVYAYQGWNQERNWVFAVNFVLAAAILALVAFLTWPGFQWVLAATAVLAVVILANKIVKKRI